MSTQLERYQELLQVLGASYAAGTLPEVTDSLKASLSVPQAGPTDTPDENGNVALLGLDPASAYSKLRFAIKEVSDSLPSGSLARITSYYNCWNANGMSIMGPAIMPECKKVVEVDNPVFGTKSYQLGDEYIPNALALPFSMGVKEATDYFKNKPEPSAGSGGFSPA